MNTKWELTTDIMDRAAEYIQANHITIYQKEHTESVALSQAICEKYEKASLATVEVIANDALARVAELMGWDYSFENFIAGIVNGYEITHRPPKTQEQTDRLLKRFWE